MTFAPGAAGRTLKAERENRGIALEDVAASTKIPLTMLEALERDDLSRWPQGLYRRAFFRAYVTAIGLPPEPLTSDFVRSFADTLPLEVTTPAAPVNASGNSWNATPVAGGEAAAPPTPLRSVLLALVELAGVAAAGALVAWASGTALLTGGGMVALVYYPLVRAAGGRRARSTSGAPRPVVRSPRASLGQVRSLLAFARTRVAEGTALVVANCRPVALRALHALRVFATTTRRIVGGAARQTVRSVRRGLAATNYAFWTVVRAVAAHAQVFAARQLNRTHE